MAKFSDIINKTSKVGIYGLGRTGISAYKFLSKIVDKELIAWDKEEISRQNFTNLVNGNLVPTSDEKWQKLDVIIVSPGIVLTYPNAHPIKLLADKFNIKILSDIDLLYLSSPDKNFIGITGTNGKSTTTALIGHILNQLPNKKYGIGGNIGTPVLDLAYQELEGCVLELSSFQLELIKYFKAKVAIFLNLTPDHLDRYESMESYFAAKKRIFINQDASDYAVVNVTNKYGLRLAEELKLSGKQKVITYQSREGENKADIWIGNDEIIDSYWHTKTKLIPNQSLQGDHNKENILASYIAAKILEFGSQDIVKSISSYKGLPHRMEHISSIGKVVFYNDSKATNADATLPALRSLKNIFWMAGGVAKEGGISLLIPELANVKKVYLFGSSAREFADSLRGIKEYKIFSKLEEAVKEAYHDAKKEGDKVNILLSPSCASLDQFKDYAHRGEEFCKIVQEITKDID